MDTVRFSKIVEVSGKPDTHLLLVDPAKDKTLQAAIKSNRVMTVYQGSGSTKTDYGTIGFEEGSSRQFLLFPKTLKSFADKRVIGIKYDLLDSITVLKEDREPKPAAKQPKKPTTDAAPNREHETATQTVRKPEERKKKEPAKVDAQSAEGAEKAPTNKLVDFPKREVNEKASNHGDELQQLKRHVHEALDLLEQGKQVAAFNLLKRSIEK
jgi:hypothetical protein